jgi:hypothetical protein
MLGIAMLTPLDETYAKVAMLEFATEVMMANLLSASRPEVSQKVKDDFIAKLRSGYFSSELLSHEQEQREAEIRALAVQLAERFVQRVAEREASVRDSRGKRENPPHTT